MLCKARNLYIYIDHYTEYTISTAVMGLGKEQTAYLYA